MNIYVAHSSSFDYQNELYQPLRQSILNGMCSLVLPHENTVDQFDSKTFLEEKADLLIAEVSYPSIGLGIELGWANMFDVPIIALYKKGMKVSGAVKVVTERIFEYESEEGLIDRIRRELNKEY